MKLLISLFTTLLLLIAAAPAQTPQVYWSPASVAVCQGAAVNLAYHVRDAARLATRYSFYNADWEFIRTITARKGSPNYGQVAIVNPAQTTLYYAVGERNGIKDTSDAFTVQVNPVPSISYTITPTQLCVNQTVLVEFSSDLPNAGYIWGNDNIMTGLAGSGSGDILFIPATTGTSNVVAQAYVGNCASMPATITLSISDCQPVRRRPPAAGIDFLPASGDLTIMNAAGSVVHKSHGADRHVDLSGLPCGVYFYKDLNGEGKLIRY